MVSGVSRQFGLDDDSIDDLKIAVTEVLGRVIDNNHAQRLTMKLVPQDNGIAIYLGPIKKFSKEGFFSCPHFGFDAFRSLVDDFKATKDGQNYQLYLAKRVYD